MRNKSIHRALGAFSTVALSATFMAIPTTRASADVTAVFASDDLNRMQSGWGNAQTGGAWTDSGPAYFSTNGDAGVIKVTKAGSGPSAYLASVKQANVSIETDASLDKLPIGGSYHHRVRARINGNSYYEFSIRFDPNGVVGLNIARVDKGVEKMLKSKAMPVRYKAGQKIRLQFNIKNRYLQAIAWGEVANLGDDNDASLSVKDDAATGPLAAGSVGIGGYASRAMTNLPVSAKVDDYKATNYIYANSTPSSTWSYKVAGNEVAVDASGSADSDGDITSYLWDFGDGGQSDGKTASHVYASVGTYTVKLTVTDDDGAKDTRSEQVVVTGKGTVLAKDDFNRADVGGLWGTALVGGQWTVGSSFAVKNRSAVIEMYRPGSGPVTKLTAVKASDVVVATELTLDELPIGGPYRHQLLARINGSSNYRLTARVDADGGIGLAIVRSLDGAETVVKELNVPKFGYAAGKKLQLRFSVKGTSLDGQAWFDGASPSTGVRVTATDSTVALQTAGAVGIRGYASSKMTAFPFAAKVDNYLVTTGA